MQIRSVNPPVIPHSPQDKSKLLTLTSNALHYLVSVQFSSLTLDAPAISNYSQFLRLVFPPPPFWAFAETDLCWEFPPSWSSFPFFPPISKLTPNHLPAPKHHLFWNPPMTTSSSDWGKGLSNVFPWQPGLKYTEITLKLFAYMSVFLGAS